MSRSALSKYLEDNACSKKYYIEHGNFMSNHYTHAAVALYHLGDTEEHLARCVKGRVFKQVQQKCLKCTDAFNFSYLNQYGKKLEPREGSSFKHHQSRSGSLSNVGSMLGERTCYYKIVEHYSGLLDRDYGGDLEGFVRGEFAKIGGGCFGAAFHPLIQVGYGLSVGNKTTVVEGVCMCNERGGGNA